MEPVAPLWLAPNEARALQGLRLNPRKAVPGRAQGERLARTRGTSIEFADFREYAEGDDLRHLDWNVLARLGQPVLRTYRDEEDLVLHLLVDTSASMGFGEPKKLDRAAKLGVGLGLVALAGGDSVWPRELGRPPSEPRPWRGRAAYARLARWAATLGSEAKRPLSESVKSFVAAEVRPGIAALLTDAMDPEAAGAVRALSARGHEVWLVVVLDRTELDPEVEGDVRLLDSETGAAVEVTANSPTLAAYRRALDAHLEGLDQAVTRAGGRMAVVGSQESLVSLASGLWRREGWLT